MTDTNATTSFKSEVEKVGESGAQAVFFAGGTGTGTVALWKQLHSADPKLLLLGSSDMVNSEFTSEIGAGAGGEHVSDHADPPRGSLSAPGRPRCSRPTAGSSASEGNAYALYGYEAMSVALRVDPRGGPARERPPDGGQPVLRDAEPRFGARPLFGRSRTAKRPSRAMASDRVQDGRAVFYRELTVR